MAIEDWIDLDDVPDECYEEPRDKTCHYCGRKNLYWDIRKAGWVLCDGRGIHRCVPSKIQHVDLNTLILC